MPGGLILVMAMGAWRFVCGWGRRPLPHVTVMDTFLKAYYLTEEDTDKWIRDHYKVRSRSWSRAVHLRKGGGGAPSKCVGN